MNDEQLRKLKTLAKDAQDASAVLWALEEVSKMYTKSDAARLNRLVVLKTIDVEQVKKVVRLQTERKAILALLERLQDYSNKREASRILFVRTHQYKWLRQLQFYAKSMQDIRERLGNVYRKKMEPLRELERLARKDPKLVRAMLDYVGRARNRE